MQLRIAIVVILTLAVSSLAVFVGCASKVQQCAVSPVEIEELRSDSRDLDTDLAAVNERLKRAEDDLAAWKARLAERRREVPELQAELARLKKASGVTEEMVAGIEPQPKEPDDDFEITPRGN